MKFWLQRIFYSFPLRLLQVHFRTNLLLILMWIILLMLITGQLGRKLGFQYLFLDPEYLGAVDFRSFYLTGLTFGGFLMTWNLTTYLLHAHHFPFLATLLRPFTKYCLNNLILPLAFLVYYLGHIIYFQVFFEDSWDAHALFIHCLGFLLGVASVVVLYFLYFRYTNRDISYYDLEGLEPQPVTQNIAPRLRKVDLEYMKMDANRMRVDTYLNESLQPRLVRSVAHYDTRLINSIFKQNHLNALILQMLGMVVLATLGLLMDFPLFRIPAAASLLVLISIFMAFIGAVSYWFHQWKVTILILLVLGINYLTSFNLLSHKNSAFGLDYESQPAPYSYEHLETLCDSADVARDKQATRQILDKWKAKAKHPPGGKPKMVLLSVSGGGLKSALWTMKVVQEADSLLDGGLLSNTVLVTGASGGMIGMAYLRELYLRQQRTDSISIYDPKYLDHISRDLLNSVAFTLVSNDLFLPWAEFQANGFSYPKDRGYMFEKQLNENTGSIMDKTIADYREPEREAEAPMLYLTPSIVNDARRLVISPQGVSFMMVAPVGVQRRGAVEIDAVDFGGLFAQQQADNLRFLSALRMNASYPYILPSVYLPSQPAIEALDAGFRDNYGILSATRFLQVFRDWIMENTSGVILVQITSSGKFEEIASSDHKGFIESLFNPFGIPGQLISLQEFEQDNSLGFIFDLLGPDHFHFIRFLFHPKKDNQLRAAISFHTTEREKSVVLNAIDEPENQSSLRHLIRVLRQ